MGDNQADSIPRIAYCFGDAIDLASMSDILWNDSILVHWMVVMLADIRTIRSNRC